MFGRPVASFIGLVGGISVLLGAAVEFFGSVLGGGLGGSVGTVGSAIAGAIFAALLGAVILFVVRPRFFWWRTRLLFNGILLLLIAVVAWVAVGFNILVLVGSFLTGVAGLLLALKSLLPGRHSVRRWL